MSQIQKFQIDVWFEQVPNKVKLGEVNIYAETEEKALELARAHTSYHLSGVGKTKWQVQENLAMYSI